MVAGGKYKIDLLKIKHGTARYEFDIDNRFFEQFETSSIQEGKLEAVVEMEKTANTFATVVTAKGTVKQECDRCLNWIDFPVGARMELLVKLVEYPKEDEDEIVHVSVSEGVFDAAQHIYDAIYLSLPLRKTCEDANVPGGCDATVTARLEGKKSEAEGEDPRWNKLKDLL